MWASLFLVFPAGKLGGAKLGIGAKAVYGAPQFRVLHWVKAPRGMGTMWCDVPDPLPPLPGPYSNALEKLFGVKPAVKSAAGLLQSFKPMLRCSCTYHTFHTCHDVLP